ncbi:MucBP domain-containing protein [Candidatus Enterococcus ikei]|uniref:MucBP domain-containing protein n=1 Tax=Candidatus Enterococcus ikei TaxID=2815326 RepID=A0ABS3GZT0_9ENTE|nr:MucBP domain-containing protein [Enterococcus sp. DIV0869a]MBO0440747.1 MucBP domain-containing protein [Enterococcus sp. DIV0869a]
MKNRYRTPVHKKKTIPTIMILALLAPIFLTPSFVFAEDLTPADKQTDVSQTQENTATTESTPESSTPLESSTFEEPTVSTTTVENDTTISTADSTTTEETAATLAIPRADVITIADPILKQAILSTLGLPAGSELTQADMDRLTNLSLNSAQISSLSGIEHATNLSSIYMNTTNNITDFSPLEQLSSLTFVTLQTKSLTSANFPDLSNNSGLTNLGLGSTSIDDDILPKIAQLTSLTRIYMDSNMNITTIAPFKALPNLKSLSVQFCGITDFTVINEFPALNDLAAFGQNTGRNDLPTTIGRSSLAYDFDQETLFLPFSMMPNRMTNFDGYVPPFTTSNSASNTYLDFNGMQLPANRLQITDEGITISGVTEDEFANLSTIEYNARLNNLAGSYAQPPGFAFYAISGGTYLHQFNVLDDGKPVTIHYQDTDGKLLLPSETRSGLVGQSFDIPVQEIPYYELIETKGDTFGTFTDQEQSITFIYKKISAPIIEKMGKVTVYYVDINNETIQDEFVQTGTIGDPFKTEKVAINGFTLKDVKGATTGLFTEEDQEVTYIYAKDETKTEPTTDSSKTNDTTPNKPAANDSAIKSPSTNDKPLSKTSATASTEKKFPATGERSNHTWLILGLVFIGFVNYQYVLKKVRQTK